MKKLIIASLFIAFGTSSASAIAILSEAVNQQQSDATQVHQLLNANKQNDTKIDFHTFNEEQMKHAETAFNEADLNTDGIITKDEFMKMSFNKSQVVFTRMDRNKDNFLSKEDMVPHFLRNSRTNKRNHLYRGSSHPTADAVERSLQPHRPVQLPAMSQ